MYMMSQVSLSQTTDLCAIYICSEVAVVYFVVSQYFLFSWLVYIIAISFSFYFCGM